MRPAYGTFPAPSGGTARYAALPVSRLPSLRAEYERSLAKASLAATFRGYVDDLGKGLPPEAAAARTILVCVLPSRHAIARLEAGGREVSLPLPSGYWNDGIGGSELGPRLRAAALPDQAASLLPLPGRLPLKLLAAKCGLVRYGRNGIAYAEGLGSSMAIRAFATDASFEEADWGEALPLDDCASCGFCAARCPTRAIRRDGFSIDAGRCVTLYNEIEGAFPGAIPARAHTALVGCLACQEACPANGSAPPALLLDALDREESAALLAGDAGSPLCASISAKLRLGAWRRGRLHGGLLPEPRSLPGREGRGPTGPPKRRAMRRIDSREPAALAFVLAGLALASLASSGCAAREAPAPEARRVFAPEGSVLGLLRELDAAFPLYELRQEAPYAIEELLLASGGAGAEGRAGQGRAEGQSRSTARNPRKAPGPFACASFSASLESGHRLLCRNFDWAPNPALVLFARPEEGYASVSMVDISYLGYSASRRPLAEPGALAGAWRLPFDGMNEKGLAVGMMAVDHAEGAAGGGRPRIGELGLIRLILDGAASVAEALELMGGYDVELGEQPIHYFLADRSGDAAVVEYLEGRMRVFQSGEPWLLATNFLLAEVPEGDRDAACWRYARAKSLLEAAKGRLGPGRALGILEAVSQPSTRWSAVYDLEAGRLELALGRDYARTLEFALARTAPAGEAP